MHTRNCMEKLLEVLIAIGDEVACLSIAKLILRHWPSHSHALHVKSTIEESEPIPHAPRGIDKLEPKHVRLKFLEKRKATNNDQDDGILSKKLNQNIELYIPEASWIAFADTLLEILLPLSGSSCEQDPGKLARSRDVRLSIQLPHSSRIVMGFGERKECTITPLAKNKSYSNCNSGKGSFLLRRKQLCMKNNFRRGEVVVLKGLEVVNRVKKN
ncbi:unnamed protein product [Ilex paraguariensis]|uniref:Uncharacterized protein n=1 Tax=Ilex paraguariensis TaxID=185542 RepID=A0ABC8UGF4_9AQUA